MAFTAPNTLFYSITRLSAIQRENNSCSFKHVNEFVHCEEDVVYCAQFPHGMWYRLDKPVGALARVSASTMIRTHNCHPGNLAHCNRCHYRLDIESTTVVSRSRDTKERKTTEAFTMRNLGEDLCVSAPSIRLTD